MKYFFPYLISLVLGYLLFKILFKKNEATACGLSFFLLAGLGLGASGEVAFYSYLFFDKLNRGFIIGVHAVLLILLVGKCLAGFKKGAPSSLPRKNINIKELWLLALLALAFIPLWIEANFYPFGGWDAWSCWNLKSKFLFLGGHHWKNMFDPLLWRASPHYPFLLPLINVWGWIFSEDPSYMIPLLNAMIFTILTVGVLFYALRIFIPGVLAVLGPLFILTLPFFVKLATSQYSDIVVAYFLLSGLLCLLMARQKNATSFALLAGLFLGFLSFTKSEGTAASLAGSLIAFPYLLSSRKTQTTAQHRLLAYFFGGLIIASLPTVFFHLFYAPANQTFTNGFASPGHPANVNRLQFILSFLVAELTSNKWNGIWVALVGGLLLTKGRCFRRDIAIFPLFLIFYLLGVSFYYYTNTYFNLMWWLSVTLSRILFSLLPLVIFWVFYSLWQEKN